MDADAHKRQGTPQPPRGSDRKLFLQVCKWAVMTAAIFWLQVYLLGAGNSAVPDFIYVNF